MGDSVSFDEGSKGSQTASDSGTGVNLWPSAEHAQDYLRRADSVPHRWEGEAAMLEFLPPGAARILDLGTGGGRLIELVKAVRPRAQFVGLDFSPTMLATVRAHCAGDAAVTVVEHDMEQCLPKMGRFDAIVSTFAIHHLVDVRKRSLYAEIFPLLNPGGVFCNLDHVSSVSPRLHREFLDAINVKSEDPSNKLLDLETQLTGLREIGFAEVDCQWKWREFALLVGVRP